ncbi:MAG: PHP domain-containing protein [Desulfobacterales bacterium]|nr:PHP domain-containing protein [Desulfobacterales bacterium]MCP4162218.1 PHP domain-containing protein [Deltaproteobacteria bacterium]
MDNNISWIDLHIHTTASDGTYSPAQIVTHAEELNLHAISVTDHDTVSGTIEVLKTGSKSVSIISGIEISSFPPLQYRDAISGSFHILGYDFDPFDSELNKMLQKLRDGRENRNPLIVKKLNDLGFDITLEEIKKISGGQVGRPHIANVMLKKGYVKSITEAFDVYIAQGAKAHVGKFRPESKVVIDLIKNAGGIPVLAHPGLLNISDNRFQNLILELKDYGLMGIEAYYSRHNKEKTDFYINCAKKNKLLVTGGSDFHGDNKENIKMGEGTGDLVVPVELFHPLNRRKK